MVKEGRMKIGIIGAGATGMAAAWDLAHAGHDVTIYEAGAEVGGLAAGFKDPSWEWTLEKFYHHWFETDVDILELVAEMGMADQLLFPRPKTSYWLDDRIIRSEMTPQSVLIEMPVSLISKVRMVFAGGLLKYLTNDWEGLERVTADSWLRRFMGDEVYNRLWKPLLIGKFSSRYSQVNMAWMWARIKTRSVKLGIYKGGFQAFLNALSEGIQTRGAVIHLNSPVEHISTQDGKPTLVVGGETHVFDRVLSTTSPGLMLKIADGFAANADGRQAAALESIGALCVVFALKQSLLTDGTYWLNLPATSPDKSKSKFPFLALVEHTNWMDKAHYNGDVLIYCGDYVPVDHEYFSMTDQQLADRFASVLPTFNAAFKPDWIRKSWVFKAPYAQPIPMVNHSKNIPPTRTSLPNVFWASMSHVYPYDRGTNYAVRLGRELAEEIVR